ncbi:hypothetical protein BSL78_14693 [Apostichopus japonicus]|uniref:Uncharacterized protein n=1 Tax=Stichopus japonicus TaxID=307972 RepID=A0A2G8KKE7_STIJA|nr:hypothetical protein BSL78_14693 [Apostichopus japonicus]
MFGREAKLPADVKFGVNPWSTDASRSHTQYVAELKDQLCNAFDIAHKNSSKSGAANKGRYDAKVRENKLASGDLVLVRNLGQRGPAKLKDRWNPTPWVIISQMSDSPVYRLQPKNGGKIKTYHRNHCYQSEMQRVIWRAWLLPNEDSLNECHSLKEPLREQDSRLITILPFVPGAAKRPCQVTDDLISGDTEDVLPRQNDVTRADKDLHDEESSELLRTKTDIPSQEPKGLDNQNGTDHVQPMDEVDVDVDEVDPPESASAQLQPEAPPDIIGKNDPKSKEEEQLDNSTSEENDAKLQNSLAGEMTEDQSPQPETADGEQESPLAVAADLGGESEESDDLRQQVRTSKRISKKLARFTYPALGVPSYSHSFMIQMETTV